MTDRNDQVKAAAAKLRLRVPGLKKSVGAGDIVRKVTKTVGMKHCSECDRRKERMNLFLRFEGSDDT